MANLQIFFHCEIEVRIEDNEVFNQVLNIYILSFHFTPLGGDRSHKIEHITDKEIRPATEHAFTYIVKKFITYLVLLQNESKTFGLYMSGC